MISFPLRRYLAGTACALLLASPAAAQDDLPPTNRFPRMMQEWLVDQMRAFEQENQARRDQLKTKEDAEAYVASVREKIRESFGPLPEKTPLNAKVAKTHDRDGYRLENVVFESRPGLPVSGNLYIPTFKEGPFPGIIGVCGHSSNGKAAEAYQSFAQGLARLGYVCLIIDPIGQGERFQYLGEGLKPRYGPGVSEHIQAGNQMTLVGEFLGTWMAWDGIRALDYLLTRPEVDPEHLGVTGNSGGGTQTTWLVGLEDRWTMSAPACFVTTFRRNAENELPADTEQCPPNILALGVDHADFLASLAPKPHIILAKEQDFFDVRGSEEAHDRLKHLYRLLGQEDQAQFFTGPTYHGFTQENREAMYQFFHRVMGYEGVPVEPTLTIEEDPVLWASSNGHLHHDSPAKTVFQFTREKAEALAAGRKKASGDELKSAIRDVLNVQPGDGVPEYRILRSTGRRKYPVAHSITYAVEIEPGIHALVTRLRGEIMHSRPPKGTKRAVLYVSHRSADAELRSEPFVKDLIEAESDAAFYAMDVRGIGESRPDICGINQSLRPYGSDYFLSAHSLMLGRPYLGQKTQDVIKVIDWLIDQGHEEIHLAGRGWGALSAAFAATLDDRVQQVSLKNALTSYQDIATTEDYQWPYAYMLPNVLAHFDLPDVYEALQAKKLQSTDPWGAGDGMNE